MNSNRSDHDYCCMMPLDLEVSPALITGESLGEPTKESAYISRIDNDNNNQVNTLNELSTENTVLRSKVLPKGMTDPMPSTNLLDKQRITEAQHMTSSRVEAGNVTCEEKIIECLLKEVNDDVLCKVKDNITDNPCDHMKNTKGSMHGIIGDTQNTIAKTLEEQLEKGALETNINISESGSPDGINSETRQSAPEKLAQLKKSILRGLRMNIPLASSPDLTVVKVKVTHRKQHVYAPILRIPNDDAASGTNLSQMELMQGPKPVENTRNVQSKARKRSWREGSTSDDASNEKNKENIPGLSAVKKSMQMKISDVFQMKKRKIISLLRGGTNSKRKLIHREVLKAWQQVPVVSCQNVEIPTCKLNDLTPDANNNFEGKTLPDENSSEMKKGTSSENQDKINLKCEDSVNHKMDVDSEVRKTKENFNQDEGHMGVTEADFHKVSAVELVRTLKGTIEEGLDDIIVLSGDSDVLNEVDDDKNVEPMEEELIESWNQWALRTKSVLGRIGTEISDKITQGENEVVCEAEKEILEELAQDDHVEIKEDVDNKEKVNEIEGSSDEDIIELSLDTSMDESDVQTQKINRKPERERESTKDLIETSDDEVNHNQYKSYKRVEKERCNPEVIDCFSDTDLDCDKRGNQKKHRRSGVDGKLLAHNENAKRKIGISNVPGDDIVTNRGNRNEGGIRAHLENNTLLQDSRSAQAETYKVSCLYCKKMRTHRHILQHLMSSHRNESAVKAIEHAQAESTERRIRIGEIVNEGNFMHNCEVFETGRGDFLINGQQHEYSPSTAALLLPCEFCLNLYNISTLPFHCKQCQFGPENRPNQDYIWSGRVLLSNFVKKSAHVNSGSENDDLENVHEENEGLNLELEIGSESEQEILEIEQNLGRKQKTNNKERKMKLTVEDIDEGYEADTEEDEEDEDEVKRRNKRKVLKKKRSSVITLS